MGKGIREVGVWAFVRSAVPTKPVEEASYNSKAMYIKIKGFNTDCIRVEARSGHLLNTYLLGSKYIE